MKFLADLLCAVAANRDAGTSWAAGLSGCMTGQSILCVIAAFLFVSSSFTSSLCLLLLFWLLLRMLPCLSGFGSICYLHFLFGTDWTGPIFWVVQVLYLYL